MTAFLALFRGINVGGNRIVKMADLKSLHESLGLQQVVTHIQSGNVVFSSERDADQLQQAIEKAFEERFGFFSHVFVRSEQELQAIIAKTPFHDQPTKEPKWIVVNFLALAPSEEAQANLRSSYSGPEEIFFLGKEAYIYYPESIGHSKLTNALFEKKLKTVGSARNWNTVLKLQAIAESLSS